MKISDFNKKSPSLKRKAPQFILQNTAADKRNEKEIEDLKNRLNYYQSIELERDNAMREATLAAEKIEDARTESSQLTEQIIELTATIEYQQTLLEKIPELEESLKSAKGDLSTTQNSLNDATELNVKQQKVIPTLKQQIASLLAENTSLTTETTQARNDKISAEEELNTIQNKYTELESFAEITSKINRDIKKELSESKDSNTYWQQEAKELEIQIREASTLENKLREWVNQLEIQDSQSNASANANKRKLETLQKIISEMDTTMQNLQSELLYVRKMNTEYRKELLRPRFMSEGAIAHREGFVIPQGKENLRTKYLGTGKPTLLKFKESEGGTDGR